MDSFTGIANHIDDGVKIFKMNGARFGAMYLLRENFKDARTPMACGIGRNLLPLLRIWSFRIFFMQISVCICINMNFMLALTSTACPTTTFQLQQNTRTNEHCSILLHFFFISSSFFFFFLLWWKIVWKIIITLNVGSWCDGSGTETNGVCERECVSQVKWGRGEDGKIKKKKRKENVNAANDNAGWRR